MRNYVINRVLVTGASGFVGSRLLEVLLNNNCETRAAVRKVVPNLDHSNHEQAVVGSINAKTLWEEALRDVACVVHLAARVHVMNEESGNPLVAFRSVNVDGTTALAEQAAALGVKRFIYLSSIKVNGETTKYGEAFKADAIERPCDAYAISKFEAEQALKSIADSTGMDVVIIRSPLVYGPGVKANFLRMMQWLEKGIPLPFGAINNKRSLVSLDNLIHLITTCTQHPAAANQIFLVGDGEDLSTTGLLRRMGVALDKPVRLVPISRNLLNLLAILSGKKAFAQRLCGSLQVDISKTRSMLGWEPVETVDQALQKTANAYLQKK